jgi:hypothetical protein
VSEPSLRRNPELAVVGDAERVVVLRLDDLTAPPRILDGTAVPVWEAIDGSRTPAELVERVARGYGVEPALIDGDVRRFLAELADLGLVVTGD